jgi:cytochrome c-type biogenesis protein
MVDPQNITIPLALLAGLLSFVSPCILPLMPVYVGYLTGQATNASNNARAATETGAETSASAQAASPRWQVFVHAVFFVAGFSLIFLILGISAGAIGMLHIGFIQLKDEIARIGGILIIVLGLHTMGVIRIPFLYFDTRRQIAPRPELGYLGSILMGITFAAGWTPCIGPMLSALIGLGSISGSIGRAAVLLTAYAMGLGVPFLLTALLLDRATEQLHKFRKHMRLIEIASGLLLIVIGVLMVGNWVQYLAIWFSGSSELSRILDNWVAGLAGGQP